MTQAARRRTLTSSQRLLLRELAEAPLNINGTRLRMAEWLETLGLCEVRKRRTQRGYFAHVTITVKGRQRIEFQKS